MMRASRYKFGSVPDVYVINEGALKGFVSISPTWSGIDNQAFQDISRQVYEDEEFEVLQREANILSGKEHSNVLSFPPWPLSPYLQRKENSHNDHIPECDPEHIS